ncbi:MAG: hypothetical protein ACD_83C00183G0002 [uncultured bacterium]|uniref:Uncharacterized protein n=1 Tax=Berkelbacteria bacterium GW2011_GWA2_38_9 TaxID=1618334 RepID=A0A0G0LF84_9BACT|nr:MAG: hypothetical protein ACD_83C00183G0002 [uncultured bacterium]KKQ90553.1 MAG: hypothetical protein UT11_C0003G0007 [Berkelbacteria bacterium GW2011_GWA2_38_9]
MAEEVQAFAYENSKGQTYFLHTKVVTLKGGREQKIFYFARQVNPEFALDAVPAAYMVSENKRTGLPLLKKKPVEA